MSELLKAQLHYREQEIDSLCNLNEELFGQISTLESELSDLKAAVRILHKHTVECDNCQRELSIADEIEYWYKYNYWNDEDRKHARTLLEVLEK